MFLNLRYNAPLVVRNEERVFVSTTLNLRTQTSNTSSSRWKINVGLEPVRDNSAARFQRHRAQVGIHTSFAITMPQHLETDVTSTQSVTANAAASAGASVIPVTSAAAFTIPEGRFITFPGSSKVYIVTATAASPTGSAVNLNVFPNLVADVAVNAVLNFSPNINVYYSNEESTKVQIQDGIVFQTSLDVHEAL